MDAFMTSLENLVGVVNSFLWDWFLLLVLCGGGIWFTFRLKFVQVAKFGQAFKATFGNLTLKGDKAGADGMTSFQSLATAIAAQVGTGNLAGAATAIATGGPGAIFWMWVSAFFGMATIFVEASMAQKYRVVGDDGEVTGGPVYYIKAAYKGVFGKVLAALFAVFIILALGFMGNMVQSNSIGDAFKNAFGPVLQSNFGIEPATVSLVVGIVVAILSLFIFVGGVSRIASITEKVVPIMAGFYIIGALIIIIMNIGNLIPALASIFKGAFTPMSLFGGVVGTTVQQAMTKGVARGLFSNEAGMGSTPHAHALAKVKHPCDQGMVAMMGVFIDTFVILNLTALVIIMTGTLEGEKLEGIALTQSAFTSGFGSAGSVFIAITMFFFAFSTIVGWYFFGERNIKYLFGSKAVKPYAVVVAVLIVVGSTLKVDLVWNMSDMFNGLMVIPNMIGLIGLSAVATELYKDYQSQQPAKQK